MKISQIIESTRSVHDADGYQVAVMLDMDVWYEIIRLLRQNPECADEETDEQKQMWLEEMAYRRMHPELLPKYKGKFVAIHQGKLVDHDTDIMTLYLRVHDKYPNQVILITEVKKQAQEIFDMCTRRFVENKSPAADS